jgi:hypothetical protein
MSSSRARHAVAACGIALLLAPIIARPQSPEMQQRVLAMKESIAQDIQSLRQYEWIETIVVSIKGEEKSREQKQCYFGADGGIQKTTMFKSPPAPDKPGLRGMIAEKKKAELAEYMQQVLALVKTYVPPDPMRIQAVKEAGKVSVDLPGGGKGARLNLRNYAKPGDLFTAEVDPASNRLLGLNVATYLNEAKDIVTLTVRFAILQDGTRYPATQDIVASAKELSINVTNSGYRKH